MRRLFLLIVLFAGTIPAFRAQQKIEIHQIDVGTGDAALINIMNNGGGIQYSILIDAGETNMNADVIAYLQANAKQAGGKVYLDYVISSHYHSDHIGGMVGQKTTLYVKIGRKKRKCGEVYSGVLGDTARVQFYAVLDKGDAAPTASSDLYKVYKSLAGTRRVTVGQFTVGSIFATNTITPTAVYPPPLPAGQTLSLGGYIDLGADANGVPVRLRLILADSRVYCPGSPGNVYNVTDTIYAQSGVNVRNTRDNANNWGVGWILEYGAFRWYSAGDVGGYNASYGTCVSCGSNYFDIETPMSIAFPKIYTQPANARGHVCAQKISHHGSCCSTNQQFMDTLRSSFISISAGSRATFGHPTQEAIDRLQNTRWNADSLTHDSLARFLMTELCFWGRNINAKVGNTSGSSSLVVTDRLVNLADTLTTQRMANGDTIFEFADPPIAPVAGDVIIHVNPSNGGIPISQRSVFTLYYEWYEGTRLNRTINCHGQ